MAAEDPVVPWSASLADATVRAVVAGNSRLRSVLPVGEVDSTQDAAVRAAADGIADGTVLIADRQLAGRGRAGRRWDDDHDGGTLALTIVLDVPPSAPLVPHALGLAVVAACARLLPERAVPRLKWPNDVVVRGGVGTVGWDGPRKLAGILVEREQVGGRDVLLCGIGLNVDLRASTVPSDRTCIATLAEAAPSRPALLAALLGALDAVIDELVTDPVALLERYRSSCETVGRTVQVALPGGREIVGRATGIDEEGRLLVDVDGRTEVVLSGTVRDHVGDEPGFKEQR